MELYISVDKNCSKEEMCVLDYGAFSISISTSLYLFLTPIAIDLYRIALLDISK